MRIVTEKLGKVHDIASCSGCEFQVDGYIMDTRRAGDACRMHVKKTGHFISREQAKVIHYKPREI